MRLTQVHKEKFVTRSVQSASVWTRTMAQTPNWSMLFSLQDMWFPNVEFFLCLYLCSSQQLCLFLSLSGKLKLACSNSLVMFYLIMSLSQFIPMIVNLVPIHAVQLQYHARHRLPTFRLIFVHVIESLVFVPVSFSPSLIIFYLCFFPLIGRSTLHSGSTYASDLSKTKITIYFSCESCV